MSDFVSFVFSNDVFVSRTVADRRPRSRETQRGLLRRNVRVTVESFAVELRVPRSTTTHTCFSGKTSPTFSDIYRLFGKPHVHKSCSLRLPS